jgi:hypothetical protein
MTERATVSVYIAIDSDGDYAFGTDEDAARERYAEDVGDANERQVIVREVSLLVPIPAAFVAHSGAAIEVADVEPDAVNAA